MATYYCDLGQGTFADNDGQTTGNAYTGPAGLQAAIRGTGSATALVAGDEIRCKGSGDASRLVLIDCAGTDVSSWGLNDNVRNKDGAGDDWTGVVVETNSGAFLGADDLALVWLASGKTAADINVADGIENTDAGGGAGDPTSVDPITSAAPTGVILDNNNGDTTSGPIKFLGVDSSWTVASPDAGNSTSYQATLTAGTAGTKSAYCFYTKSINYIWFENFTLSNATTSLIGNDAVTKQGYVFKHLKLADCSGSYAIAGISYRYSKYINCIWDSNLYSTYVQYSHMIGCICRDSSSLNMLVYAYSTVYGCISDGGDRCCYVGSNYDRLLNCVFDGATGTGHGVFIRDSVYGHVILGCRMTNNNTYGLYHNDNDKDESEYEDWNLFYGNTTAPRFQISIAGPNDKTNSTDDGYVNQAAGDFNLKAGADYRGEEIILNWDGV